MIYGQYWSYWSGIDPVKFAGTNGTINMDFVILRAAGAGKDDAKFSTHRNILRNLKGPSGALIWGADMFLGYAPGNPSGLTQAQDFWNLINAGGKEWEIPPEIDMEFQPKTIEGGKVTSYYPVPSNYVNGVLKPAVMHLLDKCGYYPNVYTNLNFINEVIARHMSTLANPLVELEWLFKCGLHVAHYTNYETPSFKYWKTYQFWQYTNTTTWTGASSICLEKRPGTRAELKEWCKSPTADWKPGDIVEPPPPVEPPVEPPAGEVIDITARADIARVIAQLNAIK